MHDASGDKKQPLGDSSALKWEVQMQDPHHSHSNQNQLLQMVMGRSQGRRLKAVPGYPAACAAQQQQTKLFAGQ